MFSSWFEVQKKCPLMAIANGPQGDARCIREECIFWEEECCIKQLSELKKLKEELDEFDNQTKAVR